MKLNCNQCRTRAALISDLLPLEDEAGLEKPLLRLPFGGWVGSTAADGITSGLQVPDAGFILHASGLEVTAKAALSFCRGARPS
jgi:hypothetical protein